MMVYRCPICNSTMRKAKINRARVCKQCNTSVPERDCVKQRERCPRCKRNHIYVGEEKVCKKCQEEINAYGGSRKNKKKK